MAFFPCSYLNGDVELTEEREQHIAITHPDLLPAYRWCLAQVLAEPDQVRLSRRFGNARLFSRWFSQVRGGKHVVVAVVTDPIPSARRWIITAYITRRLAAGEVEWKQR